MIQGKQINSITLEELFKENSNANVPVLCDVIHDNIKWSDSSNDQENGHLRLINAPTAVRYNGKKYLPSVFSFTAPSEDGKKVSSTNISISALDKRIVELIRSINENAPKLVIEAFYTKTTIDTNEVYMFSKLYHYEFEMNSVTWDSTNARFNLIFDPVMQTNVPYDKATTLRCPAINEVY